jgi:hypothetical protein
MTVASDGRLQARTTLAIVTASLYLPSEATTT